MIYLRITFHSILFSFVAGVFTMFSTGCKTAPELIKVGVFSIDATPPIGSPVAYAVTRSIVDPLKAKGIILISDEKPVVLCAVDWLGIANEGQDAWRESLAEAAGTTVDRVSVHSVHQHDGCRCDFTTEKILSAYGLGGWRYDTLFLRGVIRSAADALRMAKRSAQPVSHLGFGRARVEKVASERRILGEDGKVAITRWSKTTDPEAIAAPEGLIDPWLQCVSFWNEEKPLVVLNYYATHPMSHYGQGDVSSDFVGIARDSREKQLGVTHLYFTGATGNITAGKYNDGSLEQRSVLANRMEDAMRQAWDHSQKTAVFARDLAWKNLEVLLPVGAHLSEGVLTTQLSDENLDSLSKFTAAKHLAWLYRTEDGHKVNISSLRLGDVYLLNLPGEAFIEYQLAAQEMKPGAHICTAAYEEYGPGYLCTKIAYSQGGYESSERASRVSPEIEQVLLKAIREVLN